VSLASRHSSEAITQLPPSRNAASELGVKGSGSQSLLHNQSQHLTPAGTPEEHHPEEHAARTYPVSLNQSPNKGSKSQTQILTNWNSVAAPAPASAFLSAPAEGRDE